MTGVVRDLPTRLLLPELQAFCCQVSRTGRVRAPPVAFWANQSLRVDPKSGTLHIHNEFEDQLVFVGQSSKTAQRPAAAHREPSVIKRSVFVTPGSELPSTFMTGLFCVR